MKLAVVDENANCLVYHLKNKELIFQVRGPAFSAPALLTAPATGVRAIAYCSQAWQWDDHVCLCD